jgi:hypothetical protein
MGAQALTVNDKDDCAGTSAGFAIRTCLDAVKVAGLEARLRIDSPDRRLRHLI